MIVINFLLHLNLLTTYIIQFLFDILHSFNRRRMFLSFPSFFLRDVKPTPQQMMINKNNIKNVLHFLLRLKPESFNRATPLPKTTKRACRCKSVRFFKKHRGDCAKLHYEWK